MEEDKRLDYAASAATHLHPLHLNSTKIYITITELFWILLDSWGAFYKVK